MTILFAQMKCGRSVLIEIHVVDPVRSIVVSRHDDLTDEFRFDAILNVKFHFEKSFCIIIHLCNDVITYWNIVIYFTTNSVHDV